MEKSINAQNIVNAFAYVNLRNSLNQAHTEFVGKNEIFVYVQV